MRNSIRMHAAGRRKSEGTVRIVARVSSMYSAFVIIASMDAAKMRMWTTCKLGQRTIILGYYVC